MAFDRKAFEKDVGLRLQLRRKQAGLTQGEFAIELGIPRATYANIEGGRQRISLDVVWKAAAVLGISLDALVPEVARREAAADDRRFAELPSGSVAFPYLLPARE